MVGRAESSPLVLRVWVAVLLLACLDPGVLLIRANATEHHADRGATSFHFDFGPANSLPRPGRIAVSPDSAFLMEAGFGFEPGSKVEAFDRGGSHGNLVTSDRSFEFSAAVPEGNYLVTVTLGDPAGVSDTTVKSELRRLMLEGVRTESGKTTTRRFVVNVRTPDYPGGRVRLKFPRETTDEARAWDDRLTLEFNGGRPCLSALEIEKANVPTVFLLGDSTVCDQSKEPYASWGQMLPRFFRPTLAVANHAESGETLPSSTSAHRLDKVLSLAQPGDYVLIQFGHNDMKAKQPDAHLAYKTALKDWVGKIKGKGATPVLVTPMNRHSFEGASVVNSLGPYPAMVREAAGEEGVALIDLNAMSKVLYEALGPESSMALFKNTTDLKEFDRTHHSPYGAYELARCVIEGLRRSGLPLAAQIADDLPKFDPARPDPVARFKVPPSPGPAGPRPLGD